MYWNAEDIHRCGEDDFECNFEECSEEEQWEWNGPGTCWYEFCYSEKCDADKCTQWLAYPDGEGEEDWRWETEPCPQEDDPFDFDFDFDFDFAEDEAMRAQDAFGDSAGGAADAWCNMTANASCMDIADMANDNLTSELANLIPFEWFDETFSMFQNDSNVSNLTNEVANDLEEGYGFGGLPLDMLFSNETNATGLLDTAFGSADAFVDQGWFSEWLGDLKDKVV